MTTLTDILTTFNNHYPNHSALGVVIENKNLSRFTQVSKPCGHGQITKSEARVLLSKGYVVRHETASDECSYVVDITIKGIKKYSDGEAAFDEV